MSALSSSAACFSSSGATCSPKMRETDAWIVFPHELEGLTIDEIGAKWDPHIAEIVKAPGGPFAPK